MPAYMPRLERQAKQADLIRNLAGPLRRLLPDSWALASGGLATRVAAFPPLVMVWCMIRQALCPDPCCRATLSWLQSARTNAGLLPLASDTGAYCKARQRLSDTLLPKLALRAAAVLSAQAGVRHLWHGRRIMAADGSAFSMPDTPENQAKYPQPGSQKPGCGFPVAGFVAVICLATGALLGAMVGTWKTHELALFYYLRRHFRTGDIFLADRGFSTYAEMALFWKRGVDSVLRLHQRRRADFHSGRVLGIDDHITTWTKPIRRPKGLRREDYESLPDTLPVREIRYRVMVKGYRTSEVILTTTLLDAEKHSAEALADLYFQRWQVEVDFRHIKITMQLDVCRGKSPAVVEKEFWAHVLAYNLIRRLMWEAGDTWDGDALGLSLKGTIQHLLSRWILYWGLENDSDYDLLLALVNAETLPRRPGRVEPRVRKRRPKNYSLMTKPRHELKKMLQNIITENENVNTYETRR